MAIVLNGATSGNVTIDANAISGTSVITLPVGSGTFPLMTLSTAVATTSGTAIDFTSIPSWVKKITVILNEVSTNSTNHMLIQIGSGSIETTGYVSSGSALPNAAMVSTASSTAGFLVFHTNAGNTVTGQVIFTLTSSNIWIGSVNGKNNTTTSIAGGGVKTTSGTLDRIRLTTTSGTDIFDAGSINILMEGY
jgi:hypothetical protein